MRVLGFAVALLPVALAAAPAAGQEAAIEGVVRDATGLVLPGVTVEARGCSERRAGGHGCYRRRRTFRCRTAAARRVRRHVHAARLRNCRAAGCAGSRGEHGHARGRAVRPACGAGGRGGQPRPAALGQRVNGADRRHSGRGVQRPGPYGRRRPDPHARAFLQREPAAGRRRVAHHPAGQHARPGARSHAGAGERQAPPPRRHHHLARQRRLRWRAGAGHLHHPGHRAAAGRGAARRRFRAVRLGRHCRGAQLPAQGRPLGRQRRAAHGRLRRGRRRHVHRGGQRRAAPGRRRLRQPQPGVRQQRPHQPQRAARRRRTADCRRQRRRRRSGAGLGRAARRRQPQAVGQLRPPDRRRAGLRLRQLRQPAA